MSSTVYVVAIEDEGALETYVTRDLREAERYIRETWRTHWQTKRNGYEEPEDILDVIEELVDAGVGAVIDSHPLRSIANDDSNVDYDLLENQAADLTRVIAKCDDDAASTLIWVTDKEAESLEGIWNLVQGMLVHKGGPK